MRLLLVINYVKLLLILLILDWFFQFLTILKILVRPFILLTSKGQQKWTFRSTLHGNTWLFININNFIERIDRKISRLRNKNFLNFSPNNVLLNIFGLLWFHLCWNGRNLLIEIINLPKEYFFFLSKLSEHISNKIFSNFP